MCGVQLSSAATSCSASSAAGSMLDRHSVRRVPGCYALAIGVPEVTRPHVARIVREGFSAPGAENLIKLHQLLSR